MATYTVDLTGDFPEEDIVMDNRDNAFYSTGDPNQEEMDMFNDDDPQYQFEQQAIMDSFAQPAADRSHDDEESVPPHSRADRSHDDEESVPSHSRAASFDNSDTVIDLPLWIMPMANLREAQGNYIVGETRDVCTPESNTIYQPMIASVIDRGHLCHGEEVHGDKDKIGSDLPMFSIEFVLKPMLRDEQVAVAMIRGVLHELFSWDINDLPSVKWRMHKNRNRSETLIEVGCKDFEAYAKVEKQLTSVSLTTSKVPGKSHKLVFNRRGLLVKQEVFKATFKLLHSGATTSEPIEHEVACRVATQFAQSCQASESDEYPTCRYGVLGLWRHQVREKWGPEAVVISDKDEWTIALHVSQSVDKASFKSYFTDEKSEQKFRFDFVGSQQYCAVHADNTNHRGAPCSIVNESM